MTMRLPAPLLAAAAAGALSLGLVAPAQASGTAAQGRSLVGTATCDQGQARLATSVDANGTEHGIVTVSGVSGRRWRGGIQLNPYGSLGGHAANGSQPGTRSGLFLAKHGRFSVSTRLRDGRSLDATASFRTPVLSLCSVSVMRHGDEYVVTGGLLSSGIGVRTGEGAAVETFVKGEIHHRYRLDVTVRTHSGVQHRTYERTANGIGMVIAALKDFKGLSGFTEASVTMKDLTVPVQAETFSIAR